MMIDSRQLAFKALYKIFYDNAYSNLAVEEILNSAENGKAFTARLVYGVVERKITLDYLIYRFCRKIKPKVLTILRMGAYQIYFMDKVPVSAAINESVKLAKNNGLSYYSGLINAVLHKIDDNRVNIDSIDDLSIRYSVPQNLINMWFKAYGREKVLSFLPFVNGEAPVFAVPNFKKISAAQLQKVLLEDNIHSEPAGDLLALKNPGNLKSLKAFKDGMFHIQDLSCFEAVKALGVQKGDRVLDMCAAPGGKSFTAASLCMNCCTINAFDIHLSRVELISSGAARLGFDSVSAYVNDAVVLNKNIEAAEKIICDVPCSGYGIIRRKPEIRYKELDEVKELPKLQLRILETSAEYLKQGGRILYSTCTLNKRENEKVVDEFLKSNCNFSVISQKTIFPLQNGGDGFFYSVIERK